MLAASIITVSKAFKKKIPRDVKIVGYDDVYIASTIVPALTTIRQPIEEMGQLAIQMIIDQIDGKEISMESILPITLIERKTT